jgi:hypothetical protein
MGLHYLTFMGRLLEIKKKLTPIRIMKGVGMNSKNIMNTFGIFSYSVAMNRIFNEYYRDKQPSTPIIRLVYVTTTICSCAML